MKVAFYWWILRRTRDSPMVIMLLWNRFHWTLAKLHTPCAKKKETVHGRGSGRDEMFWVFYFIFFRAFLVRRTKLEGTTRTAAVERPTHLPPCICLDLKIWKRERVLERNQVSFIDCSVCVCVCGLLQSKKLNIHFYTLRKWREEERIAKGLANTLEFQAQKIFFLERFDNEIPTLLSHFIFGGEKFHRSFFNWSVNDVGDFYWEINGEKFKLLFVNIYMRWLILFSFRMKLTRVLFLIFIIDFNWFKMIE